MPWGHIDLSEMRAFISAFAQSGGIARNPLVEDQARSADDIQAAVVPLAVSSRLVAANPSACLRSSGSNSG